jgi:hypothetical protein
MSSASLIRPGLDIVSGILGIVTGIIASARARGDIFRSFLASSYALKGDMQRAAAELAEARRLVADGRYSSIVRVRAVTSWGAPALCDLAEATYFAGLRMAGMREE